MRTAALRRLVRSSTIVVASLPCACGGGAPEEDEVPLPPLVDVDPDVVEAVTAARALVLQDPGSSEAWGRFADRCFLHEFLREAAAGYARAEALDPAHAAWSYRLGLCLINERPELALAPLARSLQGLEGYAPAHELYAQALMRCGRIDEASTQLARANELDPGSPDALTGLGLISLSRGDLETARRYLEQALVRDPDHVEAHVALAQVALALGLEAEGRQHAELSRTLPQTSPRMDPLASPNLPPAGARARTKFGKQLERQGQREQAAEQYRQALRSNPGFYAARWNLARLLVKEGRRDEALALLREAVELDPGFEQVRLDLVKLSGPAERLEDSVARDE